MGINILLVKIISTMSQKLSAACSLTGIQSEVIREKQISYINTHIWNLEKWYRWAYLQSRSRHTDIENNCMDIKGDGEVGGTGRLGSTYIAIDTAYKIDN